MPTTYRDDGKPVVQFDPRLEISPFALFRRLREDRAPLLVDVRAQPGGHTLEGAMLLPYDSWRPPEDTDVVLFDDNGAAAVAHAARLQQAGFERTRALFGGLELYEFSLDPEVVGQKTFLVQPTEDKT
jgi:rhodanese-related sulfurtransferase